MENVNEITGSWAPLEGDNTPSIYIGVYRASRPSFGNANTVWIECSDGKYRSPHSKLVVTKAEIEKDEINGLVKKVL